MKKLLFTGYLMIIVLSSTVAFANHYHGYHEGKGKIIETNARYVQPVTFIENGFEFLIFPDGGFEFVEGFSETRNNRNLYRRGVEIDQNTRNSKNNEIRYSERRYIIDIAYNRYNQISRINNILIDYNEFGKVSRIGSVAIGYQHGNGRLRYVGKLKVNYNQWGEIVHVKGHVNHQNNQLNQPIAKQHRQLVELEDYDDSFYYYNRDGKIKKRKKKR